MLECNVRSKVRHATAQAPEDEVPPPTRSEDRLQLNAQVPHTPEAAWEGLFHALYWVQGPPMGPLPPERTPAWTGHATRPSAPMRRHGA